MEEIQFVGRGRKMNRVKVAGRLLGEASPDASLARALLVTNVWTYTVCGKMSVRLLYVSQEPALLNPRSRVTSRRAARQGRGFMMPFL